MTGILLIQLGTPDAPSAEALKPYLRQFLSDPRVIENQGWKWKLILNAFILRSRPKQSAEKYARIWDPVTGSPLLHFTKRQTELLQTKFPGIPVRFGIPNSLRLAALCHAAMFALLVLMTPILGPIYLGGLGLIGALLVYEHSLVRADDLTRVNRAFFHVNGIVSLGLLLLVAVQLMCR